MHTSKKNLFLYLPVLILFLASFIWVLKAPDHFSWSADLYLRNDDTSVLSQLFYSDNDELSQDNSTDGTRAGNIVTFSGLPDLRSLTLFRFDPTNTQESYRVTHVGFFLNGEAFFTMEAADLEAQAFPVNASWQLNGEELVFTPQNSDSSFLLSASVMLFTGIFVQSSITEATSSTVRSTAIPLASSELICSIRAHSFAFSSAAF